MSQGKIIKVSGPLVVADGLADANMQDVVRVGEQRLIGEILTMTGDQASIQVYEETSGLGPGAKVETTGAPLSVVMEDGSEVFLEDTVGSCGENWNEEYGPFETPIDLGKAVAVRWGTAEIPLN